MLSEKCSPFEKLYSEIIEEDYKRLLEHLPSVTQLVDMNNHCRESPLQLRYQRQSCEKCGD